MEVILPPPSSKRTTKMPTQVRVKGKTKSGQLCYIPTRKNPADFKSKGRNVTQVNSDNCRFQVSPFCSRTRNFGQLCQCRASKCDPELNKDIKSCSALLSEVVISWRYNAKQE